MKKKSPRGIPDFSHKQPSPHGTPAADPNVVPPLKKAPKVAQVKPHSTSMKSGRRGS